MRAGVWCGRQVEPDYATSPGSAFLFYPETSQQCCSTTDPFAPLPCRAPRIRASCASISLVVSAVTSCESLGTPQHGVALFCPRILGVPVQRGSPVRQGFCACNLCARSIRMNLDGLWWPTTDPSSLLACQVCESNARSGQPSESTRNLLPL